jgi:hypothetical protein
LKRLIIETSVTKNHNKIIISWRHAVQKMRGALAKVGCKPDEMISTIVDNLIKKRQKVKAKAEKPLADCLDGDGR